MKTIEAAATHYACMTNGHPGYDPAIRKAFIEGAHHIMSLPLAERMTVEEREKIKAEYAKTYPDDPDCGIANARISRLLEQIFGKSIFTKKGGAHA